jgi:hypothetical protein
MIGHAIMALNAVLQFGGAVSGGGPLPMLDAPSALIVTVTNADLTRIVSNAELNKFPYMGQYFRTDVGSPFSITVSSAPNPIIPGTHIPLYKISALIEGGMNIQSVLEDYPSLTREQVESALSYAKANPYSGPPYPKTTFKRALRKMDFYKYLTS